MDSNEAMIPVQETPPFNPEAWEHLREAVLQAVESVAEAVRKVAEAIVPIIKSFVDAITNWWNKHALRIVATPKEWHIYTHTKKRRIREKYRKRLARRLLEALKNDRRSDPPSEIG